MKTKDILVSPGYRRKRVRSRRRAGRVVRIRVLDDDEHANRFGRRGADAHGLVLFHSADDRIRCPAEADLLRQEPACRVPDLPPARVRHAHAVGLHQIPELQGRNRDSAIPASGPVRLPCGRRAGHYRGDHLVNPVSQRRPAVQFQLRHLRDSGRRRRCHSHLAAKAHPVVTSRP
jgi:hypothetical protein